MKLSLAILALTACSAQVKQSTEVHPDCDPGSIDVRFLYTSVSEPVVSDATAEWAQVRGCVEIPNHDPADTGHSWCCWKAEAR